MLQEFRNFLLKTNALALAVGVIIGAAVGKLVSSLVADLIMPLVGILIPGGEWRDLKWVITMKPDGTPGNAIAYGAFLGAAVDFVIISFVIFLVTKSLLRPKADAPAPTKTCPACLELIPQAASRCRACTGAV
jgi:large conductance mechanosensitive channel